jgi:hypothetical protein
MTTGRVSTLAEFFSEADDSQSIKIIPELLKLSFDYSLPDEIHDLLLDLESIVLDADDFSRSFRSALQLLDEASELGD